MPGEKKSLQKKAASVSSFLLAEGSLGCWKKEHSSTHCLLVMGHLASKGGDHFTQAVFPHASRFLEASITIADSLFAVSTAAFSVITADH